MAGEREADAEIAEGRYKSFSTVRELLDYFDEQAQD
jgi:hypothetical protein